MVYLRVTLVSLSRWCPVPAARCEKLSLVRLNTFLSSMRWRGGKAPLNTGNPYGNSNNIKP